MMKRMIFPTCVVSLSRVGLGPGLGLACKLVGLVVARVGIDDQVGNVPWLVVVVAR